MEFSNLRVYQPDGTFKTGGLSISDDRIASAEVSADAVDMDGLYAVPGLVDLHFHGCMGRDFCDGTHEAISTLAKYQAQIGVAAICPATMTYPEEKLTQIAEAAATYQVESNDAALVGINMEGPFISEAKKGAQNGAYLHAPDAAMFRRVQEKAGGLFKLCDLAPELPGSMETIDELAGEVRISIAHTTADYDTACEAFKHGARQVTHLYNAMPPFSHRAPGVIGAAFDNDNVAVELIADGVHVHPSVVRATFRLFENRVILISDSMMATGLDDGEYSLGGQAVTVRGNLATLHDGTIAGSATNLMDCVRSAVKMGVPLGQAIRSASTNPARAIGIEHDYGSLEPGKLANVLLLDDGRSFQIARGAAWRAAPRSSRGRAPSYSGCRIKIPCPSRRDASRRPHRPDPRGPRQRQHAVRSAPHRAAAGRRRAGESSNTRRTPGARPAWQGPPPSRRRVPRRCRHQKSAWGTARKSRAGRCRRASQR